MKKLLYLFMGVISISSCTNDNFIEQENDTTSFEIVHEKLTYEQVSKRLDEKIDLDSKLKDSFQENYITITKDLIKANSTEESTEILIDYFFDPIHDNETYSFITHEFTGTVEDDYLEKFVLTVERGEQKAGYLRYYPTTDFSAPLFSGKIEVSTLDRSYVGESYIENGITQPSNGYQTNSINVDCETTISIKSTRCTNGGKHRYGDQCGVGFVNDAYLYVTTYTICNTTVISNAPVFSTTILEPNPGGGGGSGGGNIVYENFYQQLSPAFQNWLKTQPNAKNHLLAYLLRHRNSTYYANIAEDLIEFLANDDYLKTNFNPLTEFVIKEALNGKKFNTAEFINFWSNLTNNQKNIFSQYVTNKKSYVNGFIVLNPEAEAFLSWAFPYLIDNPTVTVEQFENWFMMKSEGRDFFYDANYWENPNLTFAQQTLPTWSAFSAAYPNESSQQLYGVVGGAVAQAQIDHPLETQNGCALKVSRALNYSGVTIPFIPTTSTMPGTLLGADGKYYFLNAKALIIWMQKTFGTAGPTYIYKHLDDFQNVDNQYGKAFFATLKGKKGIFAMFPIDPGPQNLGGFGASGHCDKFDGVDCKAGCYFQDAAEIFFWELN